MHLAKACTSYFCQGQHWEQKKTDNMLLCVTTTISWQTSLNFPETEIEKFEDKVLELIDNLEARAAAARATAFVNLRTALQRRPLFHVISPRRVTLAGHVSKALRRGRDGEKKAAAALAPVLALQVKLDNLHVLLSSYSCRIRILISGISPSVPKGNR